MLLLVCLAAGPAYAQHAAVTTIVPGGGRSVSCGSANRGALASAARLEPAGDAWVKPDAWRRRGLDFGTDELVGVIERASRKVAEQFQGSVLGVADLSRRAGGAVSGHASHQSGRDADLIFYAVDKGGGYVHPDNAMPVYTITGRAYYSEAPSWQPRIRERWFDLARNWTLVKALIEDRDATVVAIFVAGTIERWLVDYARATGEPRELIQRAQFIMTSPRNTRAHRDHMHIRVACSAEDAVSGRCSDENAPRLGRGRRWVAAVACPE